MYIHTKKTEGEVYTNIYEGREKATLFEKKENHLFSLEKP